MYVHELSHDSGGVGSGAGEKYGVELEVERGSVPAGFDGQSFWNVIEDGSLRDSGLEFVSNPLAPNDVELALPIFYTWLNDLHYRGSIRTSTHVHANVLDHTLEELGATLATYAILEPLLFQVCGEDREENIYCVPWYRTKDQAEIAGRAIARERMSALTTSCKYSSLYLEPVIRFGTIEFRQAPLFSQQSELEFWMQLIRAITYVAPTKWDDARAVIEAFEEGCDQFIIDLFGEELTGRLRIACTGSFEDIIDNADSITVAEHLAPSLCTYKATEGGWVLPTVASDGEGTTGYRSVAFTRGNGAPMYSIEDSEYDPEMDEYYEDEEEY